MCLSNSEVTVYFFLSSFAIWLKGLNLDSTTTYTTLLRLYHIVVHLYRSRSPCKSRVVQKKTKMTLPRSSKINKLHEGLTHSFIYQSNFHFQTFASIKAQECIWDISFSLKIKFGQIYRNSCQIKMDQRRFQYLSTSLKFCFFCSCIIEAFRSHSKLFKVLTLYHLVKLKLSYPWFVRCKSFVFHWNLIWHCQVINLQQLQEDDLYVLLKPHLEQSSYIINLDAKVSTAIFSSTYSTHSIGIIWILSSLLFYEQKYLLKVTHRALQTSNISFSRWSNDVFSWHNP